MAKIVQRPEVTATATFLLDEEEMRALDALTGYGIDPFLKVFYEKMGAHYLKPHEEGLRSLFKSVREAIPRILDRATEAREVFEGTKQAVNPPPQKGE